MLAGVIANNYVHKVGLACARHCGSSLAGQDTITCLLAVLKSTCLGPAAAIHHYIWPLLIQFTCMIMK